MQLCKGYVPCFVAITMYFVYPLVFSVLLIEVLTIGHHGSNWRPRTSENWNLY